MKNVTLLFILFSHLTFSQTFKEAELTTSINEVTVYLQGALITRSGKMDIPTGRTTLLIKNLSPHIDEKSIQVKAEGAFTIVSVHHQFNYLNRLVKDKRIDSMYALLEKTDLEISKKESRLSILTEKQSLLDKNKDLGGITSGASISEIKQAIDFYDQELSSIKAEELTIKISIRELKVHKEDLEQEIAQARNQFDLPSGEIEIRIEADQRTMGTFNISYLVANAGWYPKYDIRVASVEKPLLLKYKADIYQQTGIDWKNVKLKLSNGNPNQSGLAPELRTWWLNYARNTYVQASNNGVVAGSIRNVSGKIIDENGDPLPGVNILVKGSTIGTVTDLDGNYSLTLPNGATQLVASFVGYANQEIPITSSNISAKLQPEIQQLSEVVVVGYSSSNSLAGRASGVTIRGNSTVSKKADMITTTTIENQTTVEFEVDKPYTLPSNGDKLTVDLKNFEIETLYEYYAAPKLDKDAFLIARILNWDQYNLLEGEANLYFEDAYVGRSVLEARSLEDTLNISLGRDKSIVIGREKIDEFTRRRTIGANKVETRGFNILVRNKKSQAIKLTLYDQLPVSVISNISVTPGELSNGQLDEHTGEITWELELAPQQQEELKLAYEVKYPKYEKIYLE